MTQCYNSDHLLIFKKYDFSQVISDICAPNGRCKCFSFMMKPYLHVCVNNGFTQCVNVVICNLCQTCGLSCFEIELS